MKVLVTGDREWKDYDKITHALASVGFNSVCTLIHGGCRGADKIAGVIAKEWFYASVVEYPADWGRYGKAAGVFRNQEMIDKEQPDIVLAFHSDISKSKGTLDCVKRANKAGIKVILTP